MKGKLNGWQKSKLQWLLHMKYTPRELAEELQINVRQFYRVYLPLGIPHEKDENGRIWIVGTEFYKWYYENYAKAKIEENEAYCLGCKSPVIMKNPERKTKKKLVYWLCECPDCGRSLSKIISNRGKK